MVLSVSGTDLEVSKSASELVIRPLKEERDGRGRELSSWPQHAGNEGGGDT